MEETPRPRSSVAAIAAAVLLALNLGASVFVAAHQAGAPARPPRPRYEYRVSFAADTQVEAVVQGLGREGWHITSTRRARDGGDDTVGRWGYEFFAERELEVPMQAVTP